MKVSVCVITYQRPRGLKALLESLNRLSFTRHHPEVDVVVVDNDTQGVARGVCEEVRPYFRWPLRCFEEARRGIPFARNKAVAVAPPSADFIGFVDDDETVEPDWLDELLQAQQEYDAVVVTGPSIPCFPEEAPAWAITGRFFELYRYPTGHELEHAYTNNVLVKSEVFQKMDKLFDERMALTGGSDTHFFTRVRGAGHKIVWADNALAHEWVPGTRIRVRWILQRAFRFGITTTFIARDLRSALPAVLSTIPIGLYRIGKGLFFLPLTCLLGRRFVVTYIRHICYGVGMLAGWLNVRYEEYRHPHS